MTGGLIGRERELRAVLRACHQARSVAITGGAGVGKSRLLNEAVTELRGEGWRVESLVGSHGARTVRFGAVARWLPDDPPANEALLLAHVLRTLVGEPDLTGARPARARVAVAADDANLLDAATLGLLVEVARRPDAVVILGVRTPTEIPPTLSTLMSADRTDRVGVEPLAADAVSRLAADLLGGELDDDSTPVIIDVVRGNPLFLRELLADGTDTGLLRRDGDTWALTGEITPGTRVSELIRARTNRLPAPLLDMLLSVAVAEPLAVGLVAGEMDSVGALERLQLVRIESVGAGWAVTVDHPLIGEALRQSMTTAERLSIIAGLCRSVVEVEKRPPGVAAQASTWFSELGESIPPAVAAEAGWEALVSLDLDRAIELATPAATLHWRAAFVLAGVARSRGDGPESLRWHDRAASLAGDDAAIRQVAMSRAGLYGFHLGDPKAAIASLLDAAGAVSDPDNALELQCEAAFHATLLGEFDDAVTTCRAVLGHGDLDDLTEWTAAVNLAYAQVMLGDIEDLDDAVGRARQLLPVVRSGHPAGSDLTIALSVGSCVLHGRVEDAVTLATTAVGDLREDGAHRGLSAAVSTEALLFAGDPRAIDFALESVQQLRVYDPYNSLPYGVGFAALLSVLSGAVDDAHALLAQVDETGVDLRSQAVLGRARAAITALDDTDAAAADATDVGLVVVDGGHVSFGVFCLVDALAYGPTPTRADIVADAAARSTSPYLGLVAEYARAVADGDAAAVVDVAGDIAEVGAHMLSAVGLATAAGLHTDEVSARRLAARADAVAMAAGVQMPPWRPPEVGSVLSRREVEVAVAAAAGGSDREIAESLYLSARTVGNHLHRAYRKLGLDGRDDLAEVFALR